MAKGIRELLPYAFRQIMGIILPVVTGNDSITDRELITRKSEGVS